MKTMKKVLAIMLTVLMVLSMNVVVFADSDYSITINNNNTENVSIDGKTFTAYKVFDVKYSADKTAYSYTIDGNSPWYAVVAKYIEENPTCGITLNKEQNADVYVVVTATDEETGEAAIDARALADYLVRNMPADAEVAGSVTATGETATIEVAGPGYYMVTGETKDGNGNTVVAAAALTTTDPNPTVNVKADAPKIDKKIVEGEDRVEANDGKVGDDVNYEITTNVPDMTGYKKYAFIVNDTLSKGLTYNNDLKVTVGGVEKTKDADYYLDVTTNDAGETVIKVSFIDFIQYKDIEDTSIVITYTATVNEDAVIGNDGNPNTVNLTYSTNPKDTGNGEWDDREPKDTTGTTPDEVVKTYVTGIRITKKDGTNDHVLAGATFRITGNGVKKIIVKEETYVEDANGTYWLLTDGTYTTDDPNTEGMDQSKYDDISKKYTKTVVNTIKNVDVGVNLEVTSDANGLVSFEGLDAGTYTITEISTVDGYNLLTDAITVVIESNIEEDLANTDLTITDKCDWTATATLGDDGIELVNNNGVFEFEIENNKGSKLPSTGGIGTTIFYIVGGSMMLIAVVLLVTKKKMSNK